MTYEDLNEVRRLTKKIFDAQEKLKALNSISESLTEKIDKLPCEKNNLAHTETVLMMILAAEYDVENLQFELGEAVPKLVKKIQDYFSDEVEQTILIYRYVACKSWNEIQKLIGYSRSRVFYFHNRALGKLEDPMI